MRKFGLFIVLFLLALLSGRAGAEEFALRNTKIIALWPDLVVEREFLGNGNLIVYRFPFDRDFDKKVVEDDPKTWNGKTPMLYNAGFWETMNNKFEIIKFHWSSEGRYACWLFNGKEKMLNRYQPQRGYLSLGESGYYKERRIIFFSLLERFKNLKRDPAFKDSPFLGDGLGVFRRTDGREECELLSDGRALVYSYEKNDPAFWKKGPDGKPDPASDRIWLEDISIQSGWWKRTGNQIVIWNILNVPHWQNIDQWSDTIHWTKKFKYDGARLENGSQVWEPVEHSQIEEKTRDMRGPNQKGVVTKAVINTKGRAENN